MCGEREVKRSNSLEKWRGVGTECTVGGVLLSNGLALTWSHRGGREIEKVHEKERESRHCIAVEPN